MLRENKESFPSYSDMLFNSNLDMQHTDVSISSCFASHLQPLSWCLLSQAGSTPHAPDLHSSKPDPRTEPSQFHVSMAGVKTRTPASSADTCSVGCSDTHPPSHGNQVPILDASFTTSQGWGTSNTAPGFSSRHATTHEKLGRGRCVWIPR